MALVSEYSFDEGSGLVSADSSGNGYDLTASNTSTSWDAGGHTGAGARLKHRGSLGPNSIQSACTIMCWVKRTGDLLGGANWAAFIGNSTQTILFETQHPGYDINCYSGIDDSTGTTTMTLNTWFHVAVTFTSTSHQIFINGTAEGSPGSGNSNLNLGDDDWTIVADTLSVPNEDEDFDGIVDDLRVFDTVLSGAQITTYMNTPVGGGTPIAWIAG